MTDLSLPEITIGESLSHAIRSIAGAYPSIEDAEDAVLSPKVSEALELSQEWSNFRDLVRLSIRDSGYIVLRGLEPDEGVSLLVVSIAFGAEFDTYGQGRIVKRFRMSPWTSELSHTTRAGDFHTDGNVSERPPIGTAIQCEREDPGAPEYGVQRVAHLPHLLTRLKTGTKADVDAFSFLTESIAVMAHERSSRLWRGTLVAGDSIRYHPHSLRLAAQRLATADSRLEEIISSIHQAALNASVPFHTRPGDTVLVSNRTALHYRGACSVSFTRFPTEFESRSVLVLHLKERSS